jgi:hypothetical protein
MRAIISSLLAVGVAGFAGPSEAGDRRPAPAAPAETVRYATLSGTFEDGREVDVIVREVRARGKLNSATLDVCYPVSPASGRWDRAVVELKPDGAALRGTGTSQVERSALDVRLQRKGSGENLTYEGTIRRGNEQVRLTTEPGRESDETTFREEQEAQGVAINERPQDFLEAAADALSVRVRREALASVVDALRREAVQLAPLGLTIDCSVLRSGMHQLLFVTDPNAASDLVERLRRIDGAVSVGWQPSEWEASRAIRIPAEAARGDESSIPAAVASLAAEVTGATLKDISARKPLSGEYTVVLTRGSEYTPIQGMVDELSIIVKVVPEKPDARDKMIVFVQMMGIRLRDASGEPKLDFIESTMSDAAEVAGWGERLATAVAQKLNGERWDEEAANWKAAR